MSGKLLIIGQENWSAGADVCRLLNLNQDWHIERSSWRRLVPESLQGSTLDLIVAMAVSETECAMRFFRWLRGHPVVSGTFAILPRETDAETLRATVEVVDDFVIWPARVEELQQTTHSNRREEHRDRDRRTREHRKGRPDLPAGQDERSNSRNSRENLRQ